MNEDIFGSLKWAVARGQSLQEAMMSLFNAGYPKQEIEEAARALQSGQISQQPNPIQQTSQPQQTQQSTSPQQYSQPVYKQFIQKIDQTIQPKTPQKVSEYTPQQPTKKKFFVVLLIIILIILLGMLIATFLFKNQIADILGNMG